jgi:hypothetical protein
VAFLDELEHAALGTRDHRATFTALAGLAAVHDRGLWSD